MSKIDKILERFLSTPTDFSYRELKKLLSHYDYNEIQGDGSRVSFMNSNKTPIKVHKPHGSNPLKEYQLKQVEKILKEEGFVT